MPQSTRPFIPFDFQVPKTLETSEFRLRMLTIHDVIKDYEAVMTSAAHLRQLRPSEKWPEGLTLEQNLIELGWHQHEFQRRTSFAYTVVTPSEDRVLGCVYINPTLKRDYDADVHLWARESELQGGLEQRLLAAVKDWVANEWPFKNVLYPGRDITWEQYQALPER
ncbi:MAG: GNAT family N-acetyltransferase [Myxacorys chilensis ATA2-1-KO14]|nr:GNAT family N-acetyltransferase [Myxacorys chilensis ATA2-1-KO14]